MLGRVTDPQPIDPQDPRPTAPQSIDPKLGGLLAYLLGWVGGLVVFLTQTNREVRFHGAQSVIVFGGLNAFLLLWTLIFSPDSGGFGARALFALSWLLIAGLSLALWAFLCFQGYSMAHFKMPLAGDLAERWVERQPPPGAPR
jgi:uncharacterized membrane protein